LFGLFLLRLAARQFSGLLFQDPPRKTELVPVCPIFQKKFFGFAEKHTKIKKEKEAAAQP